MTDRTAAALDHEHQAHQRRHALKLARSPEALSIALDEAAHDAREAMTARAGFPTLSSTSPDYAAPVWFTDEDGNRQQLAECRGRTARIAHRRARLIQAALTRLMTEGGAA